MIIDANMHNLAKKVDNISKCHNKNYLKFFTYIPGDKKHNAKHNGCHQNKPNSPAVLCLKVSQLTFEPFEIHNIKNVLCYQINGQ